jgi:predicted acylesterase/phospholipase RssA
MASDVSANAPRVLALSGGGFRATLFHLGVVSYLRDTSRLQAVRYITSVSGGSILAAHLTLKWLDFNGGPESFAKAAQPIIDFARINLRGRIFERFLRSWAINTWLYILPVISAAYWEATWRYWAIIPIWWLVLHFVCKLLGFPRSRIARLQAEYDYWLFKNQTLPALAGSGRPTLLIAATDMTTGDLVFFCGEGLKNPLTGECWATSRPSIAMAVAASSAFPPAFTPVEVSNKILQVDASSLPFPHFLTDGGVFDNLGGCLADLAGEAASDILLSSAEPRLDIVRHTGFRWLWRRAERSTNIAMERVSALESGRRTKSLHVCLKNDLPRNLMDVTIQQQVRRIRTDLNRFSELEIQLLYYKGYLATAHAFDDHSASGNFSIEKGVPVRALNGRWLPISADNRGLQADLTSLDRSGQTAIGWGIVRGLGWFASVPLLLAVIYAISLRIPPSSLHSTVKRWNASSEQRAIIERHPWLGAFLAEAQVLNGACNDQPLIVTLQSPSLQSSFYCLRPHSFLCFLACDVPDARILSCRAFATTEQFSTIRILEVTTTDGRLEIHVDKPKLGEQIFVIVGVCWPDNRDSTELRDHLALSLTTEEKP